jgi:hypothetical protein
MPVILVALFERIALTTCFSECCADADRRSDERNVEVGPSLVFVDIHGVSQCMGFFQGSEPSRGRTSTTLRHKKASLLLDWIRLLASIKALRIRLVEANQPLSDLLFTYEYYIRPSFAT